MEVHAHTHTDRKKWHHYFWEFFMLFLAVTLGFFVENMREHFVEHQREKQYIRSLVNDVAADTARLNELIQLRNDRERMFDSLSYLLDQGPPYDSTKMIYYYSIFIPRNVNLRFVANDGTMQQLKNAGGLRLIRNHFVVDSIVRYDVAIRSLTEIAENELSLVYDYRSIAHRFFDSRILDKMMNTNNLPAPPTNNPPLISFTKADLNEFNYKLFGIKALNRATRREIKKVLLQAENLLSMLKKEYHLQ